MIIYLASVQREINAQAAKETCLSLPVDRRGSDLVQNNADLCLFFLVYIVCIFECKML